MGAAGNITRTLTWHDMTHGIHTVQHTQRLSNRLYFNPLDVFNRSKILVNNHGAIPQDSRPSISSHTLRYTRTQSGHNYSFLLVYMPGVLVQWPVTGSQGSCDVSRDVRRASTSSETCRHVCLSVVCTCKSWLVHTSHTHLAVARHSVEVELEVAVTEWVESLIPEGAAVPPILLFRV